MGIDLGTSSSRCSGLNQYTTGVQDCNSPRKYVVWKHSDLQHRHAQNQAIWNTDMQGLDRFDFFFYIIQPRCCVLYCTGSFVRVNTLLFKFQVCRVNTLLFKFQVCCQSSSSSFASFFVHSTYRIPYITLPASPHRDQILPWQTIHDLKSCVTYDMCSRYLLTYRYPSSQGHSNPPSLTLQDLDRKYRIHTHTHTCIQYAYSHMVY